MFQLIRQTVMLSTVCIAIICFLSGCGTFLVNTTAFFPTPGSQVDVEKLPPSVRHKYLQTADNVSISAFYLPRPETSRTLLFFHGNAGNASQRLKTAIDLWSLKINVLLVDYRGYGLSNGLPNEAGLYSDAQASLKFLTQEMHVPIGRIVVYGRSLGSAVAVNLGQGRTFAGIILVSPFSSGRAYAEEQGLSLFKPLIGNPFDTLGKIKSIKSQLLIIHGDADQVLPISMGKLLYRTANVQKRFVVIPGAGHNNIIAINSQLFYQQIGEFLNAVAPLHVNGADKA